MLLNELNELIIQLSENIIIKIIIKLLYFYKRINLIQIMKIDEIIKEEDETKKEELIKQLKIDDTIDFASSGYGVQLFSIFNDINYFCIKENKVSECIIGNKNKQKK